MIRLHSKGCPNLRDAIRIWCRCGGSVEAPRRTGEVLFRHPDIGRVRVNGRRKDTPRRLLTMLRRLIDHRSEIALGE